MSSGYVIIPCCCMSVSYRFAIRRTVCYVLCREKYILLGMCMLAVMACQKQKPSPRRSIMSNPSTEFSVRSNADKVIVPFYSKEGKIDDEDYIQTVKTHIADGTQVEEEVYLIKELYIKGEDGKYLVLYNIHATVSDNLSAPLLIGQNVIQQLPKHSFDESRSVIEFDNY